MNRAGRLIVVVVLCSFALAEAFNFDRDVLSHFRSKRQLKKVCAAELYSAPLNGLCKIPAFAALTPEVNKCLGSLKMKSLADPAADPVCIYDCVYKAQKWVSATGVLDMKKIEADFGKGVGAPFAAILSAGIKKNGASVIKASTAKLNSGYVTKCKAGAYIMQTAIVTDFYNNCPANLKSPNFATAKSALLACDHLAITMSSTELAAKAAGAMKGIDTKAIMGKIPASMAGMIPKGMDISKIDTKALMANPGALAGKLPPGMSMASLAGLMGKRR